MNVSDALQDPSAEMSHSATATYDFRGAVNDGMLKSITLRAALGYDLWSPVSVYEIAERLGVTVRFVDVNMEGMYDRFPKPRIHLSALRPLPRRAFTCAHELGHHMFGHGSTIDEMGEQGDRTARKDAAEVLVDSFAAFLLMPTIGLRHAFVTRGISMSGATEEELFAIACAFGVGYGSLIHHLAYGIAEIPSYRAHQLLKTSPKSIRANILGEEPTTALIIVDRHWTSPTIDAEVGTFLWLPSKTVIAGDALEVYRDTQAARIVKAVRPGIARVSRPESNWSAFTRISRQAYVGLARYRHLTDPSQ